MSAKQRAANSLETQGPWWSEQETSQLGAGAATEEGAAALESGGRSSPNPVILSCVAFHTRLSTQSRRQGAGGVRWSGEVCDGFLQPTPGVAGGSCGALVEPSAPFPARPPSPQRGRALRLPCLMNLSGRHISVCSTVLKRGGVPFGPSPFLPSLRQVRAQWCWGSDTKLDPGQKAEK